MAYPFCLRWSCLQGNYHSTHTFLPREEMGTDFTKEFNIDFYRDCLENKSLI